MAVIESWFTQERTQPVKVNYLDGNVFSMDNNGNLIGIEVLENGEPASISGSVSASVIRADGGTVAVQGQKEGNKCSVILPQACYAVPGGISIVIKLTSGSDISTIGAIVGNVYQSSTDTTIDPGNIIPDIASLVSAIETAVDSIPLDYSNLSGAVEARNVIFPQGITGADNDFYLHDDITWEQGTWSSTGMQDSNYWIRTGLINGGFIIHNRNPEYGYIVGKFTSAGAFAGYAWMSQLVNDEYYFIPDVGDGYMVKMRQRHMTVATQLLAPSGATVEIFRVSGILFNSLRYIDNGTVEGYGSSLADVAGHGNIIFTIRASYWNDEPFNGLCINMRYAANYDVQIALPLDDNDLAFRIVNRNTKSVYMDWQTLSGKISNYLHYLLPVASEFENIFANMAGTGQRYGNLAKSQWNDIPFGGYSVNMQYTENYDIQIIFSLYDARIAYRHVARATKVPYDDWHIIGGNLFGKTVSIIGDSRSSYSGTVPEGNATYYPRSSGAVLTSLSQMWWKRVADYFGMTLVVNDSYSGGYVSNKSGEPAAKILSSDTAIANLGDTAPDIVMIFAGVNDWNGNAIPIGTYDGTQAFPTTNNNFRDALAMLIAKVQNKFPSADIWLCTNPYCCPAGTGSTASSMPVPKAGSGGTSLDAFNKAIKDMSALFGCHVIDFSLCGVNYKNLVSYSGDYSTDNGLHYNANGHAKLAKVAISALSEYYK